MLLNPDAESMLDPDAESMLDPDAEPMPDTDDESMQSPDLAPVYLSLCRMIPFETIVEFPNGKL